MNQHMDSKNPQVVSKFENLEKRRGELMDAKNMIESNVFQKFFAKRMEKEMLKLKKAYDCKTMEELKTLQGKADALGLFFKISKEIDNELKYVTSDIENL